MYRIDKKSNKMNDFSLFCQTHVYPRLSFALYRHLRMAMNVLFLKYQHKVY